MLFLYTNVVKCEVPSPVANGTFIISNLTEGGTLTLNCDQGFRIIGPAVANCTQDSLWQPNFENTSHCIQNSTDSPKSAGCKKIICMHTYS